MTMRTLPVIRYVTPLREGGSLPAIVEGGDQGLYVLKFRGAGQGPRVLVAELLAGEIARVLGLPVPEIVFMELEPELARTEPDGEIQDLIRASAGLNLALDYLPGSVTFDPVADHADSGLASRVVWFDAFVSNLDRTARNANMLMWHRKLWLIDHGAAFYFQHGWDGTDRSADAFPLIRNHVLLRSASALAEVDAELAALLTPESLRGIVEQIPDSWLIGPGAFGTPATLREAYVAHLSRRLQSPRPFLQEAQRARALLV